MLLQREGSIIQQHQGGWAGRWETPGKTLKKMWAKQKRRKKRPGKTKTNMSLKFSLSFRSTKVTNSLYARAPYFLVLRSAPHPRSARSEGERFLTWQSARRCAQIACSAAHLAQSASPRQNFLIKALPAVVETHVCVPAGKMRAKPLGFAFCGIKWPWSLKYRFSYAVWIRLAIPVLKQLRAILTEEGREVWGGSSEVPPQYDKKK